MALTICENRFKYITNLSVLVKTNPILTITLSITSFHIQEYPC
jgi:hypothetical protein